MELTRKALYEAIWRQPCQELAQMWGVPTQMITMACKECAIPLPPAGHWTRVAMDKVTVRPPMTGDANELVRLAQRQTGGQNRSVGKRRPAAGKQARKEFRVTNCFDPAGDESFGPTEEGIVNDISHALPPVRKAYRSYSSPRAERDITYQHVLPNSGNILRIAVMPECVERALLIMDAILRACKTNRWKLELPSNDDPKRNAVRIGDVVIHFTITEKRRRERLKSTHQWRHWEFRYHSTGILKFQFDAGFALREIKDGKRGDLESKISEIIHALEDEVDRVHQYQDEKKEKARLAKLQEQVTRLVKQGLEHNRQCEKNLESYLAKHEEAARIRAFSAAVEQRTLSDKVTTKIRNWLEWIENKAEEIDPISNLNSMDFARPVDVCTFVRTEIESNPEHYKTLIKDLDLDASVEEALRWINAYSNLKHC